MNEMTKRDATAAKEEGAIERLARMFGFARTELGDVTKAAPAGGGLAPGSRDEGLARVLDVLNTPVVVVGERLTVLHANEEACALFGQKIVGRSFALFFREPKALDEVEAALADGTARHLDVNLDVPIKRQYHLRISPMTGKPEESFRLVLEFQETTLIRRSETMRSEFVANVSHELRSPLATLIGFIETLRDDPQGDPANRERFLGIMEGEAQRMRRLIDDLLSLTNVELREHERPRGRVDVEDVLREVVDSLTPRARARELDVLLNCPPGLPLVAGDRDQLIQVFHNLLTNAIKYGADGDRVEISAEVLVNGLPDSAANVEVRVQDYGQGIEVEHLPRLTERFYRVDKGRSRSMGGTGLGLAIVKHIINRHRGRFLVESEVGKGSVFKVRIPIARI